VGRAGAPLSKAPQHHLIEIVPYSERHREGVAAVILPIQQLGWFNEIAQAELPPAFPVMSVDTKLYRMALASSPR
jgi:hypothetical protein